MSAVRQALDNVTRWAQHAQKNAGNAAEVTMSMGHVLGWAAEAARLLLDVPPAGVPAPAPTTPPPAPTAGNGVNDAVAYGVVITPVSVSAGTRYWKVTKVHHLSPEENERNHHIFVRALTRNGERMGGVAAEWMYEGGEVKTTPLDKQNPATERMNAHGDIPLHEGIHAVWMAGMHSEMVSGLHTKHADEGANNTLGHHSFLVEFQEAIR